MFNQNVFEEVKQNLNIREVVEFYGVKINRHNAFLCPFHSEKSPSAYIVEEKQYFHCFGCGAAGDVITFTAKLHNLRNIDAVKLLIHDFSLPFSCTFGDNISRSKIRHADRKAKMRKQSQLDAESKRKYINKFYKRMSDIYKWLSDRLREKPENAETINPQFTIALRYITEFEYYYDEFDKNPEEFILQGGIEVVEQYERFIHSQYNENE